MSGLSENRKVLSSGFETVVVGRPRLTIRPWTLVFQESFPVTGRSRLPMGRDTVNIVTDGAVLSETPPLRVDKPQFAGFGYLDPTLLEDRRHR